jgi:hypothetical protein
MLGERGTFYGEIIEEVKELRVEEGDGGEEVKVEEDSQ